MEFFFSLSLVVVERHVRRLAEEGAGGSGVCGGASATGNLEKTRTADMMVGIGDSHDRIHLISDLLALFWDIPIYIISITLLMRNHQVDLVRGVGGKEGDRIVQHGKRRINYRVKTLLFCIMTKAALLENV
jgi:hypothetical protein